MIRHESVLLSEAVEGLSIKEEGVYVDATFGAGGHSKKILEKLGSKGKLIAFDQDADVNKIGEDERLVLVRANFRFLGHYLDYFELAGVDGILADVGVSSHHLDTAGRGFSYRFEGPLDMRMNQQASKTAADVLNDYGSRQLLNIMSKYGEVRNAKTLVSHIMSERGQRPFDMTSDFVARIDAVIRGNRERYLAQVFQALRIEVNDELGALSDLLQVSKDRLNPGGRLVVIAFHSLEDRMVKRFVRSGQLSGSAEQDVYGRMLLPFKVITKKAITASEEELRRNPRSRSAKLRVAEKL
jgi:16S rRNA (cytosine1402-N4)-methyltransferase